MSGIYRRTLLSIAGAAAVGGAVGLAAGAAWGWGFFGGLLLALYLFHSIHLARLERWLSNPVGAVPEGAGSWDDVLTALHRYERNAAGRERLLADALSRFGNAAQALPEGVVILDAENRIEWFNRAAARQLGLDPAADVGQSVANLLREPAFVEYLAAGKFDEAPLELERDEAQMISLQLVPYGESQKLLVSRDVTQAARVETMRRDFVANVSHELRTPLTVLVGFLETVRELKLDPQRVRDYLAMMQDQASRMHRITEDLLTLSQLESAPPPPSDRVRVMPLLQRLLADAQALSGGRHAITLDAQARFDLLGAEGELASAFGNLVTNAVRYTPEGGKIALAWRDSEDGARFSVEDTGVGIAPEHLPRLTERFYRVDRSRSRETGGTGLGLAIVKHAVARHQATLEIDSRPGAGSRFSVRFPAHRLVAPEPIVAKE
ncbi:MAG: phosphate regulon sensor histidine kinase PhoR [Clostridia bacterium]